MVLVPRLRRSRLRRRAPARSPTSPGHSSATGAGRQVQRPAQRRRGIPRRRVRVLAAPQGIEQLLPVGAARAFQIRCSRPPPPDPPAGTAARKSFRNSLSSRSGSQESTMTASGAPFRPPPRSGRRPRPRAPASAGRVRICVSRWRKLRSALATSAVRGRIAGCGASIGYRKGLHLHRLSSMNSERIG